MLDPLDPFILRYHFPSCIQVPLEVTLNASGSSDADGIVTVQWDCEGDGVLEAEGDWSVEASKTQVCTYDLDGTYEATVQLTNSLVSRTL